MAWQYAAFSIKLSQKLKKMYLGAFLYDRTQFPIIQKRSRIMFWTLK